MALYTSLPFFTPQHGNNLLTQSSSLNWNDAINYSQNVFDGSLAIWEREDSAYQRMVEDMKKAGLNPWTGISSGGLSASSTNPAMDSLTGLLSVLGNILDNKSLSWKILKGGSNVVMKGLDILSESLNNLARAFG